MVVAAITLDGRLPEPLPPAFASKFRQPDELGESSPAMLEQLRELGYVA